MKSKSTKSRKQPNQPKQMKLKSTYLLRALKGEFDFFRPNVLIIDDNFIEFRKRNWHLVSVDSKKFHFQNVIGVFVDKHLIGASLKIMTSGEHSIYVFGFTKKKANIIGSHCSKHIRTNTQRNTTDAMSDAITSAINNLNIANTPARSKVDELKGLKELLEQGILTKEEFDEQKNKILQS